MSATTKWELFMTWKGWRLTSICLMMFVLGLLPGYLLGKCKQPTDPPKPPIEAPKVVIEPRYNETVIIAPDGTKSYKSEPVEKCVYDCELCKDKEKYPNG